MAGEARTSPTAALGRILATRRFDSTNTSPTKAASARHSSLTGPKGIGKPDKWVRDPAHVMDVMPTLIEVAGADYPRQLNDKEVTPLEGISLLPAMRGERFRSDQSALTTRPLTRFAKETGRRSTPKRMPHELKWELYNLAEDRCELVDLAATQPDRVKEMVADWEAWARRVGVTWEPAARAAPPQQNIEPVDSPQIANRSLRIEVTVESANPRGVALRKVGTNTVMPSTSSMASPRLMFVSMATSSD